MSTTGSCAPTSSEELVLTWYKKVPMKLAPCVDIVAAYNERPGTTHCFCVGVGYKNGALGENASVSKMLEITSTREDVAKPMEDWTRESSPGSWGYD
jgi:hypothetical protein